MRTIGIRDLKAQLSRALRDVQRGEHFLVTDRGRVVAELRKPAVELAQLGKGDLGLLRMAAEGKLRVAERPKYSYPSTGVRSPKGTGQAALDWVRGDG